jgi:hypothetical protein
MRFKLILEFIRERRAQGIYDFKTYHSLMTACRAVLVLIGELDPTAEDVLCRLPEILADYSARRPGVTERTLKNYQTRAKRALMDYLGRPPSARGPPVPILAPATHAAVARESPRADPYPPSEWSGTRGVWWTAPPIKLPKWLADNRSAVLWEVADAAAQSPQQRFEALRRACATGAELLRLNPHPQRVLDWVDPLPESSRAALARLRAEHRQRS